MTSRFVSAKHEQAITFKIHNSKLKKIPQQFYNIKGNILYALATSLFIFAFLVLYRPTFGLGEETLGQWNSHSDFCILILTPITLGTLLISRLLLLLFTAKERLSVVEYMVWQVAELVVLAMFVDLFISLFFHIKYLPSLTRITAIVFAVAFFPCAFYWLVVNHKEQRYAIEEAQKTIEHLRQGLDSMAVQTLNFSDKNGNVKLAVNIADVISVEAADNYVTILYQADGQLARFALRNTLKGIEPLCADTPLVRCHRSWYVNINKVKLLRKTPLGMYAQLSTPGIDDIPVSKSYAKNVTTLFSTPH